MKSNFNEIVDDNIDSKSSKTDEIENDLENDDDEDIPEEVLQFIRQEANKKVKIGVILIVLGLLFTIGSYLYTDNLYIVCWGMILTGVYYLWRGQMDYK